MVAANRSSCPIRWTLLIISKKNRTSGSCFHSRSKQDSIRWNIRKAGLAGLFYFRISITLTLATRVQLDVPNIGIFCPTFLKPEMWHVYRQVAGPKRVKIHAFAFKRENSDRFPYPLVHLLGPSKLRWARRIWQKQILHSPQLALPSECTALSKSVRANNISLLHIYFGNNGVFWLPFFRKRAVPIIVSFHGADVAVGFHTPSGQRRLKQVFEAADLLLARSHSIRQSMIASGCSPERSGYKEPGYPVQISGTSVEAFRTKADFSFCK